MINVKNAVTFILFKTTEFTAVSFLNEVLTPMSTNMETTAAISVHQISFSLSPGVTAPALTYMYLQFKRAI